MTNEQILEQAVSQVSAILEKLKECTMQDISTELHKASWDIPGIMVKCFDDILENQK